MATSVEPLWGHHSMVSPQGEDPHAGIDQLGAFVEPGRPVGDRTCSCPYALGAKRSAALRVAASTSLRHSPPSCSANAICSWATRVAPSTNSLIWATLLLCSLFISATAASKRAVCSAISFSTAGRVFWVWFWSAMFVSPVLGAIGPPLLCGAT